MTPKVSTVARWRHRHPDKVREYRRRFCAKHPAAYKNRIAAWRQAHPEEVKEHSKRAVARLRASKKGLVQRLKTKPCADCGKSYPPYVMDFDHLPQFKKSFSIAEEVYRRSLQEIVEEAAKCDVVCANCHRERTHQRGYSRRIKT